jgi:hypothetical protein
LYGPPFLGAYPSRWKGGWYSQVIRVQSFGMTPRNNEPPADIPSTQRPPRSPRVVITQVETKSSRKKNIFNRTEEGEFYKTVVFADETEINRSNNIAKNELKLK